MMTTWPRTVAVGRDGKKTHFRDALELKSIDLMMSLKWASKILQRNTKPAKTIRINFFRILESSKKRGEH